MRAAKTNARETSLRKRQEKEEFRPKHLRNIDLSDESRAWRARDELWRQKLDGPDMNLESLPEVGDDED